MATSAGVTTVEDGITVTRRKQHRMNFNVPYDHPDRWMDGPLNLHIHSVVIPDSKGTERTVQMHYHEGSDWHPEEKQDVGNNRYNISMTIDGQHSRMGLGKDQAFTNQVRRFVIKSLAKFHKENQPRDFRFMGDTKRKNAHWGRLMTFGAKILGGESRPMGKSYFSKKENKMVRNLSGEHQIVFKEDLGTLALLGAGAGAYHVIRRVAQEYKKLGKKRTPEPAAPSQSPQPFSHQGMEYQPHGMAKMYLPVFHPGNKGMMSLMPVMVHPDMLGDFAKQGAHPGLYAHPQNAQSYSHSYTPSKTRQMYQRRTGKNLRPSEKATPAAPEPSYRARLWDALKQGWKEGMDIADARRAQAQAQRTVGAPQTTQAQATQVVHQTTPKVPYPVKSAMGKLRSSKIGQAEVNLSGIARKVKASLKDIKRGF